MAGDTPRESILGTLRSEFDDDDSTLHPEFETLSTLVSSVRSAYLAFRLTPEQAATICADLRLNGSDGNEWTVGATSGAWFRRRVGERAWTKTSMPLDVEPVYDSAPSWLQEGIGGRLLVAEKQAREPVRVERDEADETATERGVINPFQRKDTGVETITVVAPRSSAQPRPVVAGDDADWLFEEWAELDRGPVVSRPQLPTNLPEDLQADRQLAETIDAQAPPAPRAGSERSGDAPVERSGSVNPEDFFLRPGD